MYLNAGIKMHEKVAAMGARRNFCRGERAPKSPPPPFIADVINVYMDDLSIKLNQSGIGGVIGRHIINHLC